MPPLAISRENLQYLCDTVLRSLTWIPEVVRGKEKSGG
jgi:hypothetical protein